MKHIYFTFFLFGFLFGVNAQDASTSFRIKIKTDSPNETFTIPTHVNETYDYSVKWRDNYRSGGLDIIVSFIDGYTGNATNTYREPGEYTISIKGDFPRILFDNVGDASKVISIEQWGDNQWTSMGGAFNGCTNMVVNTTDTPNLSQCTSLKGMFRECISLVDNGNAIDDWNVSTIQDFREMFYAAVNFDQNLGKWNVSNALFMDNMFQNVALSTSNYDATLTGWASLGINGNLKSNVVFDGGNSTFCTSRLTRRFLRDPAESNWTIIDGGKACEEDKFITTWQTTTQNEVITIPTAGSGYNYTVIWGDGLISRNITGNATHTYETPGIHQIEIYGDFPRIHFNNGGNKNNILSIEQWGNIQWTSMEAAFRGCTNLVINATDNPNLSNATSLANMFRDCFNLEGSNLSNWNVSTITKMNGMLLSADKFNGNISSWDVGSVDNFQFMFAGADIFNQDISGWKIGERVSGNISMQRMFSSATTFNKPVGGWDMSKVTNLSQMFNGASKFNQTLNNWNVSSVTTMKGLFSGASEFDQSLSNWNIESVSDMTNMLINTNISKENFETTLLGWATLATGETAIPQNITLDANGINYCDARGIAILVNDYNWSFNGITHECDESDKFITTWQTNAVGVGGGSLSRRVVIPTITSEDYYYTVDWGDGTITNDHTGNATHNYASSGTYQIKIYGNFPAIETNTIGSLAILQLQSVDQWGSLEWTTMKDAFSECNNLDVLATDAPDLSGVMDMSGMFFECSNLGASGVLDFSGWNTSTVTNMKNMFFGTAKFTGANIGNWDVSKVADFNSMFENAVVFSENLNNWNIGGNVIGTIDMAAMFQGAAKLNSPLDNWDVSKVGNFIQTFLGATDFDQDLGSWDISSASDFTAMLNFSGLSPENYDKTLEGWGTLSAGETAIPTNKELGALNLRYGNPVHRERLANNYSWTFNGDVYGGIEEEKFITTWTVTDGDLTIPIYMFGSSNDYTVDWGDGIIESGFTGDTSHTYATAGTYTVKIYGGFSQLYFFNRAGKEKIISIDQWGTHKWTGLDFSFYGCSNLELNADDVPDLSQATAIGFMFQNASSFTDAKDKLKDWEVSTITSFSGAFQGTAFNRNISDWNMQAAEDINFMFSNNTVFNQPIGAWTFNNLTQCEGVFQGATSFNQDLSNWDVSKVEFFNLMFSGATAFDQSLADWDISSVQGGGNLGMNNMFQNAGLSTDNYDATLLGWSTLDAGETQIPSEITFHGGNSNYCSGAAARQSLLNNEKWIITDGDLICADEDKFITTWKTTSNNENIQIRTTGGGSSFIIDWGDGNTSLEIAGSPSHTYTNPGTYTVKVSGTIGQLYANNQSVADKMVSVEQWGAARFTSFRRAFSGADNVVINATDIPDLSNVTSFEDAFKNCKKLVDNGGQVQNWNVSTIENFSGAFQGANSFNVNLGEWDISSMTSATNMLNGTALSTVNYDKTIAGWATIEGSETIPQNKSLGANGLNYCTSEYERGILESNGWTLNDAGKLCSAENAFITTWQTTSASEEIRFPGVTNGGTYDIDWGDGSSDIGITGTISHTYATADEYQIKVSGGLTSFFINNSPNNDNLLSIDQWGTIRWESLARAFNNCDNLVLKATDKPDLSRVTNMNLIFSGSDNFEDLGGSIGNWDVSNVEVMGYLFRNTSFNSNINNWDVRNATFVGYMFANTKKFNQPLDKWKFDSTNSLALMFLDAEAFNQDLSSWDVSHIESFASMFKNAKTFNQSLASWDISNASNMGAMLSGTNLSVANYDATLEGWARLDAGETQIPLTMEFDALNLNYCLGETARNVLTSTPFDWKISDSGLSCTNQVVWTGIKNNDWNNNENWYADQIPLVTSNIVIPDVTNQPVISSGVIAEMNNLTIENLAAFDISDNGAVIVNGDLTTNETISITSSVNTSGTLIVKGTANGNVTYERTGLVGNKWSIITAPVSGQSIKEFIENSTNGIRVNNTVTPKRYAVAYYDDTKAVGTKWTYYTADDIQTSSLTFEQGKGYIISRATDGSVKFTGTLETEDVSVSAIGNQWNSVGNPYTAYMPINTNGNANFIQANFDKFSSANVGVYIWDVTQNKYVAKTLVGDTSALTVGQGFFVKTTDGVSSINFKEVQRLSDPTDVKVFSRKEAYPSIQVQVTQGAITVDTNIKYMDNATEGLDPGYDVGNFGGAAFDVYTRLVSGINTQNFTLQSLPNANYESMVIPLGITSKAGEEVSITMNVDNLPVGVEVYLEDRKLGVETKLSDAKAVYNVTFKTKTEGIGRFFIHTKSASLNVPEVEVKYINIYTTTNKSVIIEDVNGEDFTVEIFNTLGSKVIEDNYKGAGKTSINVAELSSGAYIVKLVSEKQTITKKIIIE
ncbi:BspA family leucine-rich repeat surface protein [Tenacibaculum sp. 190524A02b]|uniref:BspA family leucine-rich repeat surface protein n=1 Tax=Tenacibaculum vairaonense TaxID=3137860 RepID=UPI0031FB09B0